MCFHDGVAYCRDLFQEDICAFGGVEVWERFDEGDAVIRVEDFLV